MDVLDPNKRAYFWDPTRSVTFIEKYDERLIDLLEYTGKKYEGVAFVNTTYFGKFVTTSHPYLRKIIRNMHTFAIGVVIVMFLYLIYSTSGVCLGVNIMFSAFAIFFQFPFVFFMIETPMRIYFNVSTKSHLKNEGKDNHQSGLSKSEEYMASDEVAILVSMKNIAVNRFTWAYPCPVFVCLTTSIIFLIFYIFLEFQTNIIADSDALEHQKGQQDIWLLLLILKTLWIGFATIWSLISCAFVVFGEPHAVFSTDYYDEDNDEDKNLDEYEVVEEDDITRLLYPELFCGTELLS